METLLELPIKYKKLRDLTTCGPFVLLDDLLKNNTSPPIYIITTICFGSLANDVLVYFVEGESMCRLDIDSIVVEVEVINITVKVITK